MGNNSTKESRPSSSLGHSRPSSIRNPSSPTTSGPAGSSSQTPGERLTTQMYSSRQGRGSRHDLSFLGIGGGSDREAPPQDPPRRETKAEREARKLEKERIARVAERERSMREEGVDGGYLVTLGTYVGPEDFNKQVVRQLMIERRLAPFWKGLDDHSDTWTEHQLVAAAQGKPIPPADEIPPEDMIRSASKDSTNPRSSGTNINHLTVPITGRSMSSNSDRSATLSPSHPAFSMPTSSPLGSPPSSSPFFRGRAKTLAALTTGSRNNSQTDMTPQEIQLPKDPYVNGQRVEAFLYKDASECPICFLYYPPYLNKTRCCDQPICSECFVQIKRPDPHPPEHHEDPSNPHPPEESNDDNQLVSEPAACPFCVQPEFGVTYESPPLRRGLTYANQGRGHPLASMNSAMSSSSSLTSQGLASPTSSSRRRTTSLSASAPQVITTDRVRPDWAKKLADARAHALRRSAAATALHNAAYVIGNAQGSDGRVFALGRRRRMFSGDSPSSSGQLTPRHGHGDTPLAGLMVAAERHSPRDQGNGDLFLGRGTSRRNRMEDLEDLMMMEAIRLSLAAEEDRKKKEEKEKAKEAKKEEKKIRKEQRKAEKNARKAGSHPNPSSHQVQENLVSPFAEGNVKGKGVDRSGYVGFNPLTDPTSTLNAGSSSSSAAQASGVVAVAAASAAATAQRPLSALPEASPHSEVPPTLRRQSASSGSVSPPDSSSLEDSPVGSLRNGTGSPNVSGFSVPSQGQGSASESETEPMFNFGSLSAAVQDRRESDESHKDGTQHLEEVPTIKADQPVETGEDSHDAAKNGGAPVQPPVLDSNDAEEDLGMESSIATMKASPSTATTEADDKVQTSGIVRANTATTSH